MKKIQLLLSFLFASAYMPLQAQNNLENSPYFKNDSLTYRLGLVTQSLVSKKKDRPVGYFVTMNMSKRIKKQLLKKSLSFWLDNLTNEKSHWATNIVLYYIYEREAMAIAAINDKRENWLQIKENEIEYWGKFLENK